MASLFDITSIEIEPMPILRDDQAFDKTRSVDSLIATRHRCRSFAGRQHTPRRFRRPVLYGLADERLGIDRGEGRLKNADQL